MTEEQFVDIFMYFIVAFHGALVFGFAWITLWQDSIVFQLDKYVFGDNNKCSQDGVEKIIWRFAFYSLIYPFIFFKIKRTSYKIGMFFYFYLHWAFFITGFFVLIDKYI